MQTSRFSIFIFQEFILSEIVLTEVSCRHIHKPKSQLVGIAGFQCLLLDRLHHFWMCQSKNLLAAWWYNLILALHIRPLSTPTQVSYQPSVHLWGCRAEWCEMAIFTTALPAGCYSKTSSAFFSCMLLLWLQHEFCRTTRPSWHTCPTKYCIVQPLLKKERLHYSPSAIWFNVDTAELNQSPVQAMQRSL